MASTVTKCIYLLPDCWQGIVAKRSIDKSVPPRHLVDDRTVVWRGFIVHAQASRHEYESLCLDQIPNALLLHPSLRQPPPSEIDLLNPMEDPGFVVLKRLYHLQQLRDERPTPVVGGGMMRMWLPCKRVRDQCIVLAREREGGGRVGIIIQFYTSVMMALSFVDRSIALP